MAEASLTDVLDGITGNTVEEAALCNCNYDRIENGRANSIAQGPADGQVRSPLLRAQEAQAFGMLIVFARY